MFFDKNWRLPGLALIILMAVPIYSMVDAAEPKIDKSKLIEVNAENKSSCVEYYRAEGKLYCSTQKLQAEQPKMAVVTDKMTMRFDGRPWYAAWGKNDNKSSTVEYIVKGDNIDNWKELVTSQYYAGLQQKISPEGFVDNFIGILKKQGFEPDWNLISKSEKEAIFEYKISQPANQVQHEIQRIITTNDGMYVVHYVVKKPDMGPAQRNKWVNLLKAAKPKV